VINQNGPTSSTTFTTSTSPLADAVDMPTKHRGAKGKRRGRASTASHKNPEKRKPSGNVDMPPPNSRQLWAKGLDWPVVVWIVVIHGLALAAPFFFSWPGLIAFLVLTWMTGSLGVCMGYHRLLTHGSFSTYRPVRWLLAFLGGLSGEGSALTWVANHRKHHAFSDREGDPHSPRDGKWWSHMLWFMPNFGRRWHRDLTDKYAPDLKKDPVMRIIHYLFLPSHFILGGLLLLTGYLASGWYVGISLLVWGLALRMVYVLHVTWFVNSASHLWGYRNYETGDDSRNNWWVGILAFGEGWHNNHHAHQRMAKQGHRWWEVDVTYWMILLMEKIGLAWDVVKEPGRRATS
jgi:stearoyl-CoA desaturase (delta-9 desaturase)